MHRKLSRPRQLSILCPELEPVSSSCLCTSQGCASEGGQKPCVTTKGRKDGGGGTGWESGRTWLPPLSKALALCHVAPHNEAARWASVMAAPGLVFCLPWNGLLCREPVLHRPPIPSTPCQETIPSSRFRSTSAIYSHRHSLAAAYQPRWTKEARVNGNRRYYVSASVRRVRQLNVSSRNVKRWDNNTGLRGWRIYCELFRVKITTIEEWDVRISADTTDSIRFDEIIEFANTWIDIGNL